MLAHRNSTLWPNHRHCEERSDAAIQSVLPQSLAPAALFVRAENFTIGAVFVFCNLWTEASELRLF